MTYSIKSLFAASLLGSSLAFAGSAMAQEAEAEPDATAKVEWVSKKFDIKYSGNGVKKEFRNKPFPVDTIYTNAVGIPGNVAISCINGVQSANVAMEPTDFGTVIEEWLTSRRSKSRIPTMWVGGEKVDASVWRYVQRFKLMIPAKENVVRKIYNASISGDDVRLKLDMGKSVDLVLPKPNKAFAEFGAACGIGRLADASKAEGE